MVITNYFRLNYHRLLMAIGDYSIIGHWWLFYWWPLIIILLVTINGYFINGSW